MKIHVQLKTFPHLHSFLLDGVEYINDCYEEGFNERKDA